MQVMFAFIGGVFNRYHSLYRLCSFIYCYYFIYF